MVKQSFRRLTYLVILIFSLSASLSYARAGAAVEEPSGLAMVTDVAVVRPLLIVSTVLGTALWVVGLPFSILGGNVKGSGEALVATPAKAAFMRCLGCTKSGYSSVSNVNRD